MLAAPLENLQHPEILPDISEDKNSDSDSDDFHFPEHLSRSYDFCPGQSYDVGASAIDDICEENEVGLGLSQQASRDSAGPDEDSSQDTGGWGRFVSGKSLLSGDSDSDDDLYSFQDLREYAYRPELDEAAWSSHKKHSVGGGESPVRKTVMFKLEFDDDDDESDSLPLALISQLTPAPGGKAPSHVTVETTPQTSADA